MSPTSPQALPHMTESLIRDSLKTAASHGDYRMIDALTDELVRIGKARPRSEYAPQKVSLWGRTRNRKD